VFDEVSGRCDFSCITKPQLSEICSTIVQLTVFASSSVEVANLSPRAMCTATIVIRVVKTARFFKPAIREEKDWITG